MNIDSKIKSFITFYEGDYFKSLLSLYTVYDFYPL